MRTSFLLLACCVLGFASPVRAEPAAPKSIPELVEALQAAAKDKPAWIDEQGAKTRFDRWLVVDALLQKGAADVAARFAAAAPKPAYAKLLDYIAARKGKTDDADARALLAKANAGLQARNPQETVRLTADIDLAANSIVGVRTAHARGMALFQLRKGKDAAHALSEAGEAAAVLGWYARAADVFHWAGIAVVREGDLITTERYWKRRMAMVEALGDRANVAVTLGNLGTLLNDRGDYASALVYQEQALAILRELKQMPQLAGMMNNAAGTYARLGRLADAERLLLEALELEKAAGNDAGVQMIENNLGSLAAELGDQPAAMAHRQRALAMARKLKDVRGEASALTSVGVSYYLNGSFTKAVRAQRRAVQLAQKLENPLLEAHAKTNLAVVEHAMGNFTAALGLLDDARATYAAGGAAGQAALVLGKLGQMYATLGNDERARRYQEQALAAHEANGNKKAVVEVLVSLSANARHAGELADAVTYIERFRTLAEEIGDPYGVGRAPLEMGHVQFAKGDFASAVASMQKAVDHYTQAGEKMEAAAARGFLAEAQLANGMRDEALTNLDAAIRATQRARSPQELVRMLQIRALAKWKDGDTAGALADAERGLDRVEKFLAGLDEVGASLARRQYIRLFQVGILAAVAEDRIADAITFIESGRAGALLESLEGGEAQRWAELPDALRKAETEAKAQLARARHMEARAAESGKRAALRAARTAIQDAESAVLDAAGRIQREAKKQAGLYYPRAATLEDIQASLDDGTTLVSYAFALDRMVAFVIESDGVRVVELGKSRDIHAACAGLVSDDPEVDAAPALATLTKLLIKPLGLTGKTKRVIVSPEGALCYIPFGALLEQPVAVTPSGSTHALLGEEGAEPGKRVLALGDPDYGGQTAGAAAMYRGGRKLAPLPATRKEVTSVGDVTFVGSKASKASFREATKNGERWRAIHLACHGLIDPKRPLLCSLALTRTKDADDDGFLTASEIKRMHIPTDIATLSACETGKGADVLGEGIVGLMRVFMYAGAPRVLCSLWKVDDAATQALMIKFYELWRDNPELGAAAALRQAQAHVRAQPQWKHPYYWAAWVLWGLPS